MGFVHRSSANAAVRMFEVFVCFIQSIGAVTPVEYSKE